MTQLAGTIVTVIKVAVTVPRPVIDQAVKPEVLCNIYNVIAR